MVTGQTSDHLRPAAHAEQALLRAILGGRHPPGSVLPAERDLAGRLGVTRPTLREALQRLHRDGWLTIRQGRETRVNDFWREGGLNVLGAMARHGSGLPRGFVGQLLEVRALLAPAYARAAVARQPRAVAGLAQTARELPDTPAAFARFDWQVHHALATASGNPIYALILNGFAGVYDAVADDYFATARSRQASRAFYRGLGEAARRGAPARAEAVTREAMRQSRRLWAGRDRRKR
jgi:GntR family negative regulator for fad regulon and positive regulator of fabA